MATSTTTAMVQVTSIAIPILSSLVLLLVLTMVLQALRLTRLLRLERRARTLQLTLRFLGRLDLLRNGCFMDQDFISTFVTLFVISIGLERPLIHVNQGSM